MAEGSPLPFPSPSAILGEHHDSPPTSSAAAAAPAPPPPLEPVRRPKHARSPSRKDTVKKAVPKKAAAVEADAGPDTVKGAKVDKPKQTKSRNGNCYHTPCTTYFFASHLCISDFLIFLRRCTSQDFIPARNTDERVYQVAPRARRSG